LYKEGLGMEKWPDGSFYEGMFKAGKKHGKGQMKFPDSSNFEGEFAENEFL